MQIISDTLTPRLERWDDPSDATLPGGPQPSHRFVAEVLGEVVLELESGDFMAGAEGLEVETDLPHGVKVTKWHVTRPAACVRGTVVLSVLEFEAERVELEEEGD
jgi:hypothetical protein